MAVSGSRSKDTFPELMSNSRDFTLRRPNRRNQIKEYVIQGVLIACSFVAIFTTIGIVASLAFEAYRFFGRIPLTDFLFGLEWSPQTAMRSDQVGASGKFGVLPLLSGTLLISFIAMCVATPLGILSAVYLAEFARPKTRNIIKPMLELLAGIPTVVYGFFAALVVAPIIRNMGSGAGFQISSESALAAGLVMGIMLVPFISSLSDCAIVAQSRDLCRKRCVMRPTAWGQLKLKRSQRLYYLRQRQGLSAASCSQSLGQLGKQ